MYKKIVLSVAILAAHAGVAVAQGAEPYWGIIGYNASYSIVTVSAYEAQTGVLPKQVKYAYREPILIIDQVDGVYFGIDPIGRFAYIDGEVFPAQFQNDPTPGVAVVNNAITIQDGTKIKAGTFLWCVSIDVENETAKIQTGANQFVNLPLSKLGFRKQIYTSSLPDYKFRDVVR